MFSQNGAEQRAYRVVLKNGFKEQHRRNTGSTAVDSDSFKRNGYSFRLVNIDCLPSSEHFNVIMDLDESIEELLPYLAGILPGCTYIHQSGVISLMDAGHIVAIYPLYITITDVGAVPAAEELCRHYFSRIMEVKARKHTITPVYERRPSLSVLDIIRLLPKTNCGACGSPTCMAFAVRLMRREGVAELCLPLKLEDGKHLSLLQQMQTKGWDL